MERRLGAQLDTLLARPDDERVAALAAYGGALADAQERGETPAPQVVEAVVGSMLALMESGVGLGQERLALGEALGRLGDPRLRLPADDGYWAHVAFEDFELNVARYPVTTWEWRHFVVEGGYENDGFWSEEGRAWRDSGRMTWADLARDPDVSSMIIPNQPVVGVTWFEAEAYANASHARLLTSTERRRIVRGPTKRPYPWGAPFGQGNSNTREEVLGKPCAVGLFSADCTPEGVSDLAGNVAEWLADTAGALRLTHPGSWQQPSMASWAKAVAMFSPDHRSGDLGFRLARD